ncbi:MAG: hypothetical protein DRJ99_01735 [Thermoplasmata archaeon]|nr:MAG: hypothetical protein DRJ99_01735 [Thermoplasmata archaeon]
MKTKYYLAALIAIGIYVIIDGIGSIIVYKTQPIIFDHFMRIIRIIVGILISIISIKLWKKLGVKK